MSSLLLPATTELTCAQIAQWFGAMQSQDYASGQWSLGVRMPGSTATAIQQAFEEGSVLRTWPMRGTIHTVASGDARWLLELTGVRALATAPRRREQLGLSTGDVERAAELLEQELTDHSRLTRKQALAAIERGGIPVTGQRGYHLLWYAAQTGRTCIGPHVGADQTFVLLDRWAPHQVHLDRDTALTELALRYFRSHGPATEKDFAGWSGLTVTDCRRAITANDGRLVHVQVEGTRCWLSVEVAEQLIEGVAPAPVIALPGFDEFMLGYKDRSLQVPEGSFDRIVPGGNGVFRATIAVDGRAAGTWSRRVRTTCVEIDVDYFDSVPTQVRASTEQALQAYADFLGLPPVVRMS